ncbi:hypothetical protein [Cohnella silvisoli]|uniref:Uncharacterized protein n=1 Tax=Cohnella silvisoli TaxID=2873699 RepID=A0ABV1L3Y3_9BACL|nr:hypothetical protein [Cohnella silvisoli]MCD9021621.1 hypothetical protein [Cohnella silvisoli]
MKSAYRSVKEEGYLIIPEIFRGNELAQLKNACDGVLERFTIEHDREKPQTDLCAIFTIPSGSTTATANR